MWATLLETIGGEIARLTPNTPPAMWLPYVGYTLTTIGALLIAFGTMVMTRSRLASAAMAIGFTVTSTFPGDPIGPLVIALALLGLLNFPKPLHRSVVPILVFSSLLVFGRSSGLLLWAFAGCGLVAVTDQFATARGKKGSALRFSIVVLLTVIAVTARVPAAETSTPPAPKPLGHDRITLKSMRALLSNVPSGSAIVRDDLVTSMLLRAMKRDFLRAHVQIAEIDNNAAAIRETLKTQRVFALPFAQQSLSMQGLKIVDGLHVADRGLAEIIAGADCIAADHRWQDAPQLAGHTSLALVASDDDQRGPVVLLLSGQEEFIRVNPVGWVPRTQRGFSPNSFDLHSGEGMRDFAAASEGDPISHAKATSNMLTRVALWRTPDAPQVLRIDLSLPAPFVAVYLSAEAKSSVSVCPVFPAPVFEIR